MLSKLSFLLKPSAWLLALLILASVLPAKAQDEPYLFEWAEDGSGYIMKPRPYETYEGVLDVPAVRESDGLPVVGVDGFSYQERLLGIQFFEGSQVKYIGSFQGCTGIEFIADMPATVETIADYAFYGCTRLHDISLNEGLKYIGISCFEGCEMLESIKLPKSLKVLRERAFRVCTALGTVEFNDSINFYDGYSYGFYNNVFDGCENLQTVKLPKNSPGNFIIPMATFSWCGSLKSIEFPANTRRIDQQAFYRSGIENLDLTTITSEAFYVEGYHTFAACENLKSVTANGNFQFGNTSLYTFQECKSLKSVTINGSGDDFIAITPDAFRWCDSLETVEVYRLKGTGENNEMDSVFVGCKSLQKVISTCPPELNKFGYCCFLGCESLKEVSIPTQAFLINDKAFKGCAALESIDLANVTSIGDEAFTGCSALASINLKPLSNNLPTVENENAFDAWHFANTLITVPDDKYSVFTADAFWSKFSHYKHPSLFAFTEVPGGYSVSKSPYALDEDFTGMLVIPEQYNSGNVVAIAEGTFQDFTGLTGVTLPSGLTSIGSQAFAGCTGITTVINKAVSPLYGDECPDNIFDSDIYLNGNLYVPFGSLDAYKSFAPWANFNYRIKQGFGERSLQAPGASHNEGEYDQPIELTLTNPNSNIGTIYYYIINEDEGNVSNEVHTVETYSAPIRISANCTIVAQISDDTHCSEPTSWKYTRLYESTESGLDKVLAADAGKEYLINTSLFGHYHDGTYLYASTMGNSGSSKNTVNEDKKAAELSDKESDFNQEDWVAISGLTSDFVGKEIASECIAAVVSNTAYPVISFNQDVQCAESSMDNNKFRVENFNIASVSDIWLVAPQPAEYCAVKGYLTAANVHESEGYLLLQSAESETTTEGGTAVEPLTMKAYYDAATITVGEEGWYTFAGIVSEEDNGLVFTVTEVIEAPTPTSIDAVGAGGARIFAANGNINVAADAPTSITIYSATGQLVSSLKASSATIAVAPGFYLVKVGNTTVKIAVK